LRRRRRGRSPPVPRQRLRVRQPELGRQGRTERSFGCWSKPSVRLLSFGRETGRLRPHPRLLDDRRDVTIDGTDVPLVFQTWLHAFRMATSALTGCTPTSCRYPPRSTCR